MQLLLLSLALVPLIVMNSLIYPYVSGKVLLIRIVITAVLLLLSFKLFKPQFRAEVSSKLKVLFKNKLFLSVLAYFSVFTLSTIFAFDKIRAFAGTPERGEGFIGIFFFIIAFILFLLLFKNKHWQWFFRLNLIAGLILFIHQLFKISNGILNASLIGNRGFFGVYFLFILFCAVIVWRDSKILRDKFWLWFSSLIIPMAVIAVFIPDKKGIIASLAIGSFTAMAYWFVYLSKTASSHSNRLLKKALLWLMALMIIFGGVFFATKKADIWQNIPGLKRIADASLESQTILARKVSAGISFDAINPSNHGLGRLMLGWGWDNYRIAWHKNYDPAFYIYEPQPLDRSHNKLLDVLVMNGVLGLLAYLSIWMFFFGQFFKSTRQGLVDEALPSREGKSDGLVESAFVFFGVAYFVQNLYTFDQISTYIPFFVLLAYSIFYFNPVRSKTPQGGRLPATPSGRAGLLTGWVVSTVAVIFLVFFTIIPMIQIKQFLTLGDPEKRENILTNNFIFSRYFYVDFEIRKIFTAAVINSQITDVATLRYLDRSLEKMEEGLDSVNGKMYPEYLTYLAAGFVKKGLVTGDKSWYDMADDTFEKAIKLSPSYQSTYIDYAGNLLVQNRKNETEANLRKALTLNEDAPDSHFALGTFLALNTNRFNEAFEQLEFAFKNKYFIFDVDAYRDAGLILDRLYDLNDKDRFLQMFVWFLEQDPDGSNEDYIEFCSDVINYIETTGELPNFKESQYRNEFGI